MVELRRIEDVYKARQERIEHPYGTFDRKRRWYPDDNEKCSCCDKIRSPSVAYPYSLLLHCRTKVHITNLLKKREPKNC